VSTFWHNLNGTTGVRLVFSWPELAFSWPLAGRRPPAAADAANRRMGAQGTLWKVLSVAGASGGQDMTSCHIRDVTQIVICHYKLPGAWFSVPDFDDRVPDSRELLDAASDAFRAADAASEVFRAADAASDEFRAADAASDAFRAADAVADVLRAADSSSIISRSMPRPRGTFPTSNIAFPTSHGSRCRPGAAWGQQGAMRAGKKS